MVVVVVLLVLEIAVALVVVVHMIMKKLALLSHQLLELEVVQLREQEAQATDLVVEVRRFRLYAGGGGSGFALGGSASGTVSGGGGGYKCFYWTDGTSGNFMNIFSGSNQTCVSSGGGGGAPLGEPRWSSWKWFWW
jgi:hypothetical protein